MLTKGTKVLFQRNIAWHDETWYTGIILGYNPMTDCYAIRKDGTTGTIHTTSDRVKVG